MDRNTRWFRRLVRLLFPEDFRADYESEMARTFSVQQREAASSGGAMSLMRLWWDTIAGLLRTAPREHVAQLRQDVSYAFRMMRRTPGFTAIAILTLATGIGANTAIFSVVNAVLLRPLPYAASDDVALMWNHWKGSGKSGLSNPEFLDTRERMRSADVAGYSPQAMNLSRPSTAFGASPSTALGAGGDPERIRGLAVTSNFLTVLGVNPMPGRNVRAQEELPGQGRVVLLMHDLWTRLLDASPDAIGGSLMLDNEPYTIVGVLPESFVAPHDFGALQRTRFLLPLTLDPAAARNERGSHYMAAVVRPRRGFSLQQAQAELDGLTRAFQQENPGEYDAEYGATLFPIRSEIVGDVRRPLLILLGAVSLVLLIACANVANLLLARGQVRGREIAVRKALGASRARLVRQVLTESAVLSVIAAAAGVLLARWLASLVQALAPSIPRVGEAGLDPVVLAFTAGLSIATAFVFGSLPALQFADLDMAPQLHAGRSGRRGPRRAVRATLVAAQVALALVLLVGAALLMQSFARLLRVPPGFNPDRVLTLRLTVPVEGYQERERVVRFFEQMLGRVRRAPGVVSAGAVAGLPVESGRGDWDFYMEGETPGPHGSDRPADWQVVTPGYFETMGIRLVRGRFPAATDRTESPAVAVINETLAKTFFAGRDPIGRQIRMSGEDRPWMTIVGIAGDVRQDGLDSTPQAELYMPHSQFRPFWRDTTLRTFTVVVRSAGEPVSVLGAVRQHVRALDASLAISAVVPMDEIMARSVAEPRLLMVLLGAFAAIAVGLAVVGTYGVLAYQITERTRELGVRMALGAGAGDILRMVLGQGMAPALAGASIGLVGAALATRMLTTLLFETEPFDPATCGATASLLLLAALAACLVPALRATRVDPSTALRAE